MRLFAKLTCLATLILIFIGGMVTSTGSGLAVPDWPLSYGTWFPPMVGGVFYEHGHRMAASVVGFLMLCLAIWVGCVEKRRWVRCCAFAGLAMVVIQGILGGLTVLYFLPTPISVSHGVLAQSFFVMTIFIAYSLSKERAQRNPAESISPSFLKIVILFCVAIYLQLILGAVMRHTGSGLAIYDFPTMAGSWFPKFDAGFLARVNDWRFENNLELVSMEQVMYHLYHRIGAGIILLLLIVLNVSAFRHCLDNRQVFLTVVYLDIVVLFQILLGIMTVLSQKTPMITSFHVMTGAATLGISVLLFLRAAPIRWGEFRQLLD